MNKRCLCRTFFSQIDIIMRHRNTIEVSLIYLNALLWILLN